MISVLLSLLLSSSASASEQTMTASDLTLTPYGLVHRSCLHRAPRGSVIHEREEHTELVHKDGRVERFEKCSFFDPRKRVSSREFASVDEQRSGIERSLAGAVNLNGWIDYTGWYPASTPIIRFEGNNTVPSTPSVKTSQTLFWFIGTQNNEDTQVRILQPVLTYVGPKADSATGVAGWSAASWNCCPNGQVWFSDPITDFSSGDQLLGRIFTENKGATYTIDYTTPSGAFTSLEIATVGPTGKQLTMDWADVTLEVYDVTDCNQLTPDSVTFSDMTVLTGAGATQETPKWTVTQGKTCTEKVTVTDPATVVIQATP